MSKHETCQFCYQLYTPPAYFRAPSQSCDACWLYIQGRLSQQTEPVPRLLSDWWCMTRYPHNCQHEVEQELIELDHQRACDAGDCEGAPVCALCLDRQERGDEALGG